MNKPFVITPVYDKLLRGDEQMPVGLYHLHLATAAQLTRLHYSMGSYKTIRQRLKQLSDAGYVVITATSKKVRVNPNYYTVKKGQNYYTLGTKGFDYLASIGFDVKKSSRGNKD